MIPSAITLIPLSVAARKMALSMRTLQVLCQNGEFKTAVRPGGPRGNWRIAREEIEARVRVGPLK